MISSNPLVKEVPFSLLLYYSTTLSTQTAVIIDKMKDLLAW
jgi:hypothetical protein